MREIDRNEIIKSPEESEESYNGIEIALAFEKTIPRTYLNVNGKDNMLDFRPRKNEKTNVSV